MLDGEVVGGGGQFLGVAPLKAVQVYSNTTVENLVVPAGSTGVIMGSLTFEDGASFTLEDDATVKVL